MQSLFCSVFLLVFKNCSITRKITFFTFCTPEHPYLVCYMCLFSFSCWWLKVRNWKGNLSKAGSLSLGAFIYLKGLLWGWNDLIHKKCMDNAIYMLYAQVMLTVICLLFAIYFGKQWLTDRCLRGWYRILWPWFGLIQLFYWLLIDDFSDDCFFHCASIVFYFIHLFSY